MDNIMIALISALLLISPSSTVAEAPQGERITAVAEVDDVDSEAELMFQSIDDFVKMKVEMKRLQEEPVNEMDSYFSE